MNPKKIGITIASALFVLIGGITGVQYLQDSPEESSSSDALTASGSETTAAATETYQTTAATETTTVSMQTTAPAQTESAPAMTLVSDAKGASYYTFRTDALLESHYEKHGIEMGFDSAAAYEAAANAVIANPEVLHKYESEDGDDVYYLADTNEFVVVSVLMGMILTLPISSAALGIILNLSGLAAGAATIGCCCNMVGFAVASYRENKVAGLLAQGIGTSMLQVPNIVRKPIIWIPAIVSSAVLGPVSTMLVKMTSNATGSGMGTAGFVGQIMTYQTMEPEIGGTMTMIIIVVFQIVLPAVITLAVSEFMRKKGWIKDGDMKLEL